MKRIFIVFWEVKIVFYFINNYFEFLNWLFLKNSPNHRCKTKKGIHLEGPVVLDCGGLPCSPSSFRPSDDETARDAFEQLLSLFPPGVVKIMTIAPTYCEKYSYLLEKLKAHDIVVALGHDRNNNVDLVQLLKKQSPSWRFHLTHA